MSLLDDLRSAAHSLDQQFQLTSNELPAVLSALVYHLEHPADFLKAAEDGGIEAVTELLSPAPPARTETDPTASTSPAGAAGLDVAGLSPEQLADLQAQIDTRRATAQQTTVTHETGGGDPAAPPQPANTTATGAVL